MGRACLPLHLVAVLAGCGPFPAHRQLPAQEGEGVGPVALSRDGTLLAAGRPNFAEVPCDVNSPGSGVVRVYRKDSRGEWAELAALRSTRSHFGDNFGAAVAIDDSGRTIAVGAPVGNGAPGTPIGAPSTPIDAVHLFSRGADDTWSEVQVLESVSPSNNGHLGASVALSGDGSVLVAGNPVRFNHLAKSGAQVFRRSSDGTWSKDSRLVPEQGGGGDGAPAGAFGAAVAISGDGTVAAVGDRCGMGQCTGSVSIFQANASGQWALAKTLHLEPPVHLNVGDNFGAAVALSEDGSVVVVGLPGDDHDGQGALDPAHLRWVHEANGYPNNVDTGAVAVFRNGPEGWALTAFLKNTSWQPVLYFGSSVSVSRDGTRVASVAPGGPPASCGVLYDLGWWLLVPLSGGAPRPDDVQASSVQTFHLEQSGWAAEFLAEFPTEGGAVGLSGDGRTLAMGRGELELWSH